MTHAILVGPFWSQTQAVTEGTLFGVGFMDLKNLWEESTGVPAFS